MTEETARKPAAPGVIHLSIQEKAELYRAYMPFIKNGGLFIKTDKEFQLGDEVLVSLKLMEEIEKFPIIGTVIWVTPACAQGGLITGIGIQFAPEKTQAVRNKIETYLAGASQDESTATM